MEIEELEGEIEELHKSSSTHTYRLVFDETVTSSDIFRILGLFRIDLVFVRFNADIEERRSRSKRDLSLD